MAGLPGVDLAATSAASHRRPLRRSSAATAISTACARVKRARLPRPRLPRQSGAMTPSLISPATAWYDSPARRATSAIVNSFTFQPYSCFSGQPIFFLRGGPTAPAGREVTAAPVPSGAGIGRLRGTAQRRTGTATGRRDGDGASVSGLHHVSESRPVGRAKVGIPSGRPAVGAATAVHSRRAGAIRKRGVAWVHPSRRSDFASKRTSTEPR